MAKQPLWKQGLIFLGVLVVLWFSRTVLQQDPQDEQGGSKPAATANEGGAAKAAEVAKGANRNDAKPAVKTPQPSSSPAKKAPSKTAKAPSKAPAKQSKPVASSKPVRTPSKPSKSSSKAPSKSTAASALPSKLSARKLKAVAESGDKIIEQAYRAKRSKVWVESVSRVIKLFRDDNVGHRHQLFLVKLGNGLTLKVAHNIDLAPRVPVKVGDTLHMRGRYEFNDKGGVMHWTHHDPQNRGPGGWIWHKRKCYK